MTVDFYRLLSKGKYDTDFSFLNTGSEFPSKEVQGRNIVYRYRHKQYTGEYARNKRLIARIQDREQEIPYKVISLNYFKLLTNKMTDLVLNNDIVVKTGDIERDKLVNKIIRKYNVINTFRKSFKMCLEYGDACIKTNKKGVSAFNPLNAFKVVDESNSNNVKAIVLYELLYDKNDKTKTYRYIRFEIHFEGTIFELVKTFDSGLYNGKYGGRIGDSIEFEYKGRKIKKEGMWYNTDVLDCNLIQWISINTEDDGVYGSSVYGDIEDIVYAIEQRISVNQHLLDNSMTPFLVVGMDMIDTDPETGKRSLKLINGTYMVSSGDTNVKSVELNYNLENSENMLGILKQFLYELSEMGKTFLSGEYSGNISEETLNNTIKSAIDKANRLINETYYMFRDSIYCLCVLNNIEISKESISIIFNVGRTDDEATVANICTTLISNGILSKATVREKYYGYNKEQSDNEDKQIAIENGQIADKEDDNNQDIEISNKDNVNIVNNNKNKGIPEKEEITNETN